MSNLYYYYDTFTKGSPPIFVIQTDSEELADKAFEKETNLTCSSLDGIKCEVIENSELI